MTYGIAVPPKSLQLGHKRQLTVTVGRLFILLPHVLSPSCHWLCPCPWYLPRPGPRGRMLIDWVRYFTFPIGLGSGLHLLPLFVHFANFRNPRSWSWSSSTRRKSELAPKRFLQSGPTTACLSQASAEKIPVSIIYFSVPLGIIYLLVHHIP